MRKKQLSTSLFLAVVMLWLCVLHALSFAQQTNSDAAIAAQEKVQNAKLKMNKFLGSWAGKMTVSGPDASGQVMKDTQDTTAVARSLSTEGIGVIVEVKSLFYSETDLFGYDEVDEKFHMLSVGNNSTAGHYVGDWKDENTLEMISERGTEKGKLKSVLTLVWKSAKELNVKIDVTLDSKGGNFFATLEGTLTKK